MACTLAVAMAGCGGEERVQILVSAAASLDEAFTAMETVYEEAHPDIDVVLNFGASSTLREQILEGAPVDVFAPADLASMEAVTESGHATGEPEVFARNSMQIVVTEDNPGGVGGLDDLGDPELFIGICADGVPCGELARQVLDNAGIAASVDTNEANAASLIAKIGAGELDAGIGYVTDVIAAGGTVEGVDIPASVNVSTDYPIALVSSGADSEEAAGFIGFVLSDQGQAILARLGFASR